MRDKPILPGTGRGTARKARGGGASSQAIPPIVYRARALRREMSYPEVLLWQRLRGSPCGVRFRKQHQIGLDYVADFYCAAAKLVIEVDGEVHSGDGAPQRDAIRDDYIRERGLTVVRVPARDILRDVQGVAEAIVSLVPTPLHHRPAADGPPPRAGEEFE